MNKIDSRLIQTVVLLDRQYLLTEHLIRSKDSILREFENAISEQRETLDHVLDVYNFVFALIDHLVRYHKIATVLPRFNQREAQFRNLRAALDDFKDIRNTFQHINNDIENDNSGPLLGAVCWISEQMQFIASFHDIGRQRSSPGIVLDTTTGKFVHEFCYVYNDKYYDLARAINAVRSFNDFINSRVKVEINKAIEELAYSSRASRSIVEQS
jgi:hypothetical protein